MHAYKNLNSVSSKPGTYTKVVFKNPIKFGFISVIIPVYNDPDGLMETLLSLQKQTLDSSQYEIIVANDGADPLISSVCRDFKVREVKITPNSGSYFARNRAIEESKGEYIAFVDADITVHERWVETGTKALQSADYVGGPVYIDRSKIKTPAHYSEMRSAFPFKTYMEQKYFSGAGNLFIRRSVIEDIGGFDERLQSGGDKEFGKRVYDSEKYRQYYEERILAIHPPRGYKKLVNQRVRITKGDRLLSILYPDRFTFERPSIIPYILNTLKPPWVGNIRRGYSSDLPFSFVRYYLFCWKYKIVVNLRKIPVYYSNNFK